QLETSLMRAPSRVEFDGSFTNHSRLVQQVAGVSLTHAFGDGNHLAVNLGRARDKSRDYLNGSFVDFFNTRRDSMSAQWDLQVAAGHVLTVGVDYLNDVVDSSTNYDVDARDNKAVYLQYVGDHGPWRTEVSVRGDDNEQFGNHSTVSTAL